MKGYYRNILLVSAAILAVAACTKPHVEEIPSEPMPISISATEGTPTKALLDNGTFKQTGNRIRVYDFVDDTHYFDDLIGPDVIGNTYGFDGVWPFENGPHQWTPGRHKFFGWLAKDVSSGNELTPESLIQGGFPFAGQQLTIPTMQMTAYTPQFDFMYSDIFTTEPINEPVDLTFSHLFTAVSFGIVNDASSPVTIHSLEIELYNAQSAKIDYSGTGIPVYSKTAKSPATYRSVTDPGFLEGMSNGISDKWVNAFNISATDKEYILMWPHSEEELADCRINIAYTLNNDRYTQSLPFPSMALNAGEKYHFDIYIADKAPIRINYLVVDWGKIDNNYTFE